MNKKPSLEGPEDLFSEMLHVHFNISKTQE